MSLCFYTYIITLCFGSINILNNDEFVQQEKTMRISEILNGLTAIQLNEADKPRNKAEENSNMKKSAEDSADTSKQDKKPKADKSSGMQDPGANKAAKGKYQKPDTKSKAAGSSDKSQQQPSAPTDLVKGGKGQGNVGGQAKRAANQKIKSGQAAKDDEARSEKDQKQGTLDPLRTYGQGTDATAAADKWADTVGTEEYADNSGNFGGSPTPSMDAKDNQAHGFDNPDALNNAETADMQDDWDEEEAKKPGDQLPPHDPDAVKIQLASDDVFQREIGKAMERANTEWFEAQASAKEAQSRMGNARGDKEPRKKASPEVAARNKQKASLAQKNKDSFDSLSPEQKAAGNATGAKRGSLEVTHNLADVNKAGDKLDAEGLNQAAAQAAQGDEQAQAALFKNMGRMLFGLARKYSFGNQDKLADMYGESKAALMQAIKTYDPAQGAQFSTWLYKNVDSLVKNAAYADRNVQVEPRQLDKVAKYKKLQDEMMNQGIQGVDADLAIIDKMGLKSWDELDKIKQHANMANTTSMSTPVGGDEGEASELGDTLGGQGVESDYTAGGSNIGGAEEAGDQLGSISKELATADDETKAELFGKMADEAELDQAERDLIDVSFGMGGKEPLTSAAEIQMATGMTTPQQTKALESALRKMALYLVDQTGEDFYTEYENLKKIFKDRKFEYGASQAGRDADDYVDDESMKDAPADKTKRSDAKWQRREKRKAETDPAKKAKAKEKKAKDQQKAIDKERKAAPANVKKAQAGVKDKAKKRKAANADAVKRNKAEGK